MTPYVSTLNFGLAPLTRLPQLQDVSAWPAIEISSGHPYQDGVSDWLRRLADTSDRRVLLHNFVPLIREPLVINLCDADAARRSRVLAFLRDAIALASALGGAYYSFHAGYRVPYQFGRKAYPAQDRMTADEATELFGDGLRSLLPFAEAQGVHLGVENHAVEPGNEDNLILFEPDAFLQMLQGIDSPFLHVHFDAGHWNVTSRTLGLDRAAFVRRLGDRILAAHLHDNDGLTDAHRPFEADAWFLDELPKLSQLRYACLETASQGDAERIRRLSELVQSRLAGAGRS